MRPLALDKMGEPSPLASCSAACECRAQLFELQSWAEIIAFGEVLGWNQQLPFGQDVADRLVLTSLE